MFIKLDIRDGGWSIYLKLSNLEHPRIDIPVYSACHNVHDHDTWKSHDDAIGFRDRIDVDQRNSSDVDYYSAPVTNGQI